MRAFLLVLSLLIPMTSSASAEDPRLSNVRMAYSMEEIPEQLIGKQLAHLKKIYPELSVQIPMPDFKLATRAYMKDLYEQSGNKLEDDSYISALYINNPRTIHLSIQWNPDNIDDRGSLYHELVHDVQYMNGLDKLVQCEKVLEFQAYYATATYFMEVEKLPTTHRTVREAMDMTMAAGACPEKVMPSK